MADRTRGEEEEAEAKANRGLKRTRARRIEAAGAGSPTGPRGDVAAEFNSNETAHRSFRELVAGSLGQVGRESRNLFHVRGRPNRIVAIASSGLHPARKRFAIAPAATRARRSRAHAAMGFSIPHASICFDEP